MEPVSKISVLNANVRGLRQAAVSKISVLYANVRGLRQAAGELRSMVLLYTPEIVILTETHLNGDSVEAETLPQGYKVVTRYDRTKHGGGIIVMVQDQLLLNVVKCDPWCSRKSAEIVGFETKDWAMFGCYTQDHRSSPALFAALCKIRESDRFSGKKLMFFMDANAHHSTWLGSTSTDQAGEVAKAFAEDYGMDQFVTFPTRGVNKLDLIIEDVPMVVQALPHLGSSDHVSMLATFESVSMPAPPPKRRVFRWKSAPWDRIRGALRLKLGGWKASVFDTLDAAVDDLYEIIQSVIDRYVKTSVPGSARPAPWWNRLCSRARQAKYSAFEGRESDMQKYKAACTELRFQERKAFCCASSTAVCAPK